MVQRTPGFFDYYQDKHGGANGDTIRADAQDPKLKTQTLDALAKDLGDDGRKIATQMSGEITSDVQANAKKLRGHAQKLAASGHYAVALLDEFAGMVDDFDSTTNECNVSYNSKLAGAKKAWKKDHPSGKDDAGNSFDLSAARSAAAGPEKHRYQQAEATLETGAHHIATMFAHPTNARVKKLIDAGLLPLSAAVLYPGLHLTDADIRDYYKHAIAQMNSCPLLATIPDAGTSPADVNKWWNTLSSAQQAALIALQPQAVGNLDGVPCVVRDIANRIELPKKLAQMKAQLRKEFPDGEPPRLVMPSAGVQEPRVNPDWTKWTEMNKHVANIEGLQKAIGTSTADSNTYLLGFEPDQGQGHAITSYGNPDRATNVETLVGGMTTNLGDMPEYMKHSQDTAKWMHRYGAERPAAVTWWGYDAPPGLLSAATTGRAADGAPALDSFQSGLRATHDGQASINTVVGHSYGSVLVGEAASHGRTLNADNIVFIGSPGVSVDHASDLHLTGMDGDKVAQHVYASKAEHDIISLVDGTTLGPDPTSSDFGAEDFQSDPGPATWGFLPSVGAHTHYWSHDNMAIKDLGSIGAGAGRAYPVTPPEPLLLRPDLQGG